MALSSRKRGIALTVGACVVFVVLVVLSFVHKMTSPRIMNESELKTNGAYMFEHPRSLSDIQLVDDEGQVFTLAQLEGKWSLLFFGFTFCPDVCPTTLSTLLDFYTKLDDKFAKDTQIILVSVDPARDTPQKLHDYVGYFHPDFIGVTGDFLDLHRFATELNVPFSKVPGGGENYLVEHGANIALVNPQGHYVGFFKAPIELAKLKTTYQSIRVTRD